MRLAYDNAKDMKKERKKKGRLNFKVKKVCNTGSPLNLDDNVRSHNNDIAKYQEHAPLLWEVEAVELHLQCTKDLTYYTQGPLEG